MNIVQVPNRVQLVKIRKIRGKEGPREKQGIFFFGAILNYRTYRHIPESSPIDE
jgi:hypothetical protein